MYLGVGLSRRGELMNRFDGSDSLEEARAWLRDEVSGGHTATCPCCERAAGYLVTLTVAHARELWRFAGYAHKQLSEHGRDSRLPGGRLTTEIVHAPSTLGAGAKSYSQDCISVWVHFGVLKRVRGPHSGEYVLTEKGRDFILGRVRIYKHAWCFNGEVLKRGGLTHRDDLISEAERKACMGEAERELHLMGSAA
jgi:hypothetical protein